MMKQGRDKTMTRYLKEMTTDQLVNYRCNLAFALGLETREENAKRLMDLIFEVDSEIQSR
jgi:hypothetical protein